MSDIRELCRNYFRQQTDLGMPSYIFSREVQSVLYDTPFQQTPGFGEPLQETPPNRPSVETPAPEPVRDTTSEPGASVAMPRKKQDGAVRAELVAYYKTVVSCHQCPLGKSRKKFVFGAGNAESEIMVIGEAPGADEDRQGVPFVGRAGQLLTKMLAAIGLNRENDVFITNILKCRPPQNRNPETSEIHACMPILDRQIEIIAPKALLLLGRISANTLLDTTAGVGALRGKVHTFRGIPAMVTYHPAALLRQQQYKRAAWEDLQKFQALLREQNIYAG